MLIYICISYLGVSNSLRHHGLWPNRLLCPWNSLGKNSRVGGHSLLQGIFPTQGSNLDHMHYRQNFNRLSHQRSPMNLYIYPYMLYIIYRCIYINMLPKRHNGKESDCQHRRCKRGGFDLQEDPVEKEMATHSSTLAWKIAWTKEPGRLQSMGLQSQTLLGMHACVWTPTYTHTHTRCCASFSCLQER